MISERLDRSLCPYKLAVLSKKQRWRLLLLYIIHSDDVVLLYKYTKQWPPTGRSCQTTLGTYWQEVYLLDEYIIIVIFEFACLYKYNNPLAYS